MKTELIASHVSKLSAEAREDIAANRWDDAMTDALYATCGAQEAGEMAEARSFAREIAAKK